MITYKNDDREINMANKMTGASPDRIIPAWPSP